MPKSLGQIHTTHFNFEAPDTAIGAGDSFLCDGSAALSTQFNRNIRMMSIYKLVGADLVIQLPDDPAIYNNMTSAIVKGRLRYFQPTKGRCNALRDAYQQFRTMAKSQGVDPGKNKLFDFRIIPRPLTEYPLNNLPPTNFILNTSTFDGVNELVMRGGGSGHTVFTSYNDNIRPRDGTVVAGDFASGLDTWQSGTQTDFVLNEGTIQSGNPLFADEEMEQIPFELAFDIAPGQLKAATLQWRPDPALYLGILGGFVEVVFDEIATVGTGILVDGIEFDISLHWAGWKSIVREPKSRRMLSSKKSSSRKKKHSRKK